MGRRPRWSVRRGEEPVGRSVGRALGRPPAARSLRRAPESARAAKAGTDGVVEDRASPSRGRAPPVPDRRALAPGREPGRARHRARRSHRLLHRARAAGSRAAGATGPPARDAPARRGFRRLPLAGPVGLPGCPPRARRPPSRRRPYGASAGAPRASPRRRPGRTGDRASAGRGRPPTHVVLPATGGSGRGGRPSERRTLPQGRPAPPPDPAQRRRPGACGARGAHSARIRKEYRIAPKPTAVSPALTISALSRS